MVSSRLRSLIRKEFIQIVRDPRTLGITIAMPAVMLFMLGYAITNDVRNIDLAVFDQDQTPASRRLISGYQMADYFRLAYFVSSAEEIRQLIDNNSARAGLIIPPAYGRTLAAGRSAKVAFILDGSDPTVAGNALSAAVLIGQSQSTSVMMERFEKRGMSSSVVKPPIDVLTQVLYNPALVSANYMIPALIGQILQFLTSFLTATSIVRERERGTIEQLIVTPLRSWELIVGKLTPYVLISFMDTIEILVVGILLFRIPINGSVILLLFMSALFLVTTLGIGLLISTVANTQQEAMLTAMFTILPSIFLSGFFFPLAAMPKWLQVISYIIPLRYFLIIARGIVLKGVGFQALWPETIALTIFAVVVMGAAAMRFRKSLE
jgi:ABC-2 type transport system permease protein